MRLLYVEWVDHYSQGDGEWAAVAKLKADPVTSLVCRSVGWLVRDDGKYIRLVANLDGKPAENGFGVMNILKRAVRRRVELKP